MTRINTNIASLVGAMYLNRNMQALNVCLERLATGTRINSARDDPEGVMVGDMLRGELTGLASAISNAERANNLLATAENSVATVSELLLEIKGILFEVANSGDLTNEELEAKQLQLDNDIQAINSAVRSASFAGQKLLDGSLSYQTTGADGAAIADLMIHKAPVGGAGGEVTVAVSLLTSAERASLIFPNPALASDLKVRFNGPDGTEVLDFSAGTTSTDLVLAINSITESTGLAAELVNGDPLQGVRILTVDYGSAATVRAEVLEGNPADFALQDELGVPAGNDSGVDAEISVNGSHVVGRGLRCHYASASTDMEIYLDETWNNTGPPAGTDFEITSGGALFQLGPQIGGDQQDSIGIPALDSTSLGLSTVGYLSELASGGSKSLASGQFSDGLAIVSEASRMVSAIRARIGSFQNNTLTMTINSLKQSSENVSAARSAVVDADYAEETAAMARYEILLQANQAAMAMAQQIPQSVLRLLLG